MLGISGVDGNIVLGGTSLKNDRAIVFNCMWLYGVWEV